MELQHAVTHPERLDAALKELQNIIAGVQGLLAYPLKPLVKIVVESGEWLTNNPLYDRLLEDVIGIMQTRVSNAEAGRILLERGFQKLRGEQTYDAIRLFGRAWQKLAVRECREELIAALLGCGMAYAVAGLPWAARASVLAVVNQAFSEFVEEGSITPLAVMCVQKMVWAELQLGRVPHVLQWMDVALATAQPLILRADRKKEFFDEREDQDRVFSILLLKADLPGLESMCFLPPVLENLGLNHSWMTLLYALGYEDLLRSEGVIPESEGSEAIQELFGQMTRHPAAQDLPDRPELLDGESITLRSYVLGCAVAVHADNSLLSLFLGEQILGSLEGLLATSLERRMFPHAEDFHICIAPSPEV